MSSTEDSAGHHNLLAGYIHETDMAAARGVGLRALRAERQRGDGPPYVVINRAIYYSETGWRDWLKAIEKRPTRVRRVA